MGLIKTAIIGGAVYYAVKGFRGDREGQPGRCRRSQEYQASRGLDGEKPVSGYNANVTDNAQAYPVEQHPYPYNTNAPYSNEKQPQYGQQQQQEPPLYQQMTFTEPKHAYHVTDMIPRDRSPASTPILGPSHDHNQKGMAVVSGYGSSNYNDDAVEQAMRHLTSGDQDKAREVLSGAISRKY